MKCNSCEQELNIADCEWEQVNGKSRRMTKCKKCGLLQEYILSKKEKEAWE
jgi:hypothetical protein